MEIVRNIDRVREEIADDHGLGERIKDLAVRAVFDGSNSTAWVDLMKFYTSDGSGQSPESKKELDRLCGKDAFVNSHDWARECLAYIVGDSTCGPDSHMPTGAMRTIRFRDGQNGTNEMERALDAEY